MNINIMLIPVLFICSNLYAGSAIPYIDVGTSTPTANRVVKFDATGKLNVTGIPALDISTMSGSVTSSQLSSNLSLVGTTSGFFYGTHTGDGSSLTGITASVGFGGITGEPDDNQYFREVSGTATVPVRDASGYLSVQGIKFPGTTTGIIGTISSGRWYSHQNVRESYVTGTQISLRFNGGSGTTNFVDSSSAARTMTAVGNASHSPTQVKFGSTSCYLDGTGDSVTTTNVTNLSPGTQTFYIDAWAYYNGTHGATDNVIFGKRSGVGSWGNDGHEYYLSVSDTDKLNFSYNSSNNPINIQGTNTITISNGWHHYKVVNASNGFFLFFDGVIAQNAAKINITATTGGTPKFVVGERNSDLYWNGFFDEVNFVLGSDGETSNFTPPVLEYGDFYNYHSAQYIPPGTTTARLIIEDKGTATGNTYLLANVTTLIAGAGTTDVVATVSAYSIWSVGAVRATAFNVASTAEIKENIKDIEIKPDFLDAEQKAKENYFEKNKSAWVVANKKTYTSKIEKPGTGTITYVDTTKMEQDYTEYIELQWLSNLDRGTLTRNVQKKHAEEFWQKFDSIRPRSWNPKENPKLTRSGFLVEESPDEIKGDDGQSICSMKVIAIQQKALQAMKAAIERLGGTME